MPNFFFGWVITEDFAKEKVSQSFIVYCIGVGKIAALADVSAT
jgi:hypothetical protein